MNISVIDNFLDADSFKQLQTVMLENSEFPWYVSNGVVKPIDDRSNDFLENYQFTHLFYDNFKPNSEYYGYLTKLIEKINPDALIRIKANLNPVSSQQITYDFHVDMPKIKCKTAVFYINSNNGYTIVGDEKIASVENRIVIFDSNIMHTGTTCTDQKYRCVINFNYFASNLEIDHDQHN
jgi:hypothetical protein